MHFIITFLFGTINIRSNLFVNCTWIAEVAISSKIHEKLLTMMYYSFVHHVHMHRLPMALNCYNIANEIHYTIDSRFAAMELALSKQFGSLSDQLKELEGRYSTSVQMETAEPLAASRTSTLDPAVAVLSIADKLSDREL